MKKVILGGGLIAVLARDILGPDWDFIPMGKSTFYSFDPPLADNYVIKDPVIDDYMRQYSLVPIIRKMAFSYAGQLSYNRELCLAPWLQKVYGTYPPTYAHGYWKGHMENFSYGDCRQIYTALQSKYITALAENHEKYGPAVEITADHLIRTKNGQTIEYDQIISTIPLRALLGMMGVKANLESQDQWCYHIRTKDLDFEGADHLLVVDREIEFFKASKINQTNYVLYATQQIQMPGRYFMAFMKDFELVGEVKVPAAIACGGPADQDFPQVAARNIECLGSLATWDDCLDVGSCIKRLVRRANG
jgi:hypothetical protein